MTLKPCRGCGVELLAPDAPLSIYGICDDCLKVSEPVDPEAAWGEIQHRRHDKGLNTVNLTELADEETGYRNVVVGAADTMPEQERYE